MCSPNESHDLSPPESLQPRWQISLAELLAVLTLIAVCFGMTSWLANRADADARPIMLLVPIPFAVMTAIGWVPGTWIVPRRAGPRLCWLRLATLASWWGQLPWIIMLLAYLTCSYFVGPNPMRSALAISIVIGATLSLWMSCLWGAAGILFGSLALHEEGIVVCCDWGPPGLNLIGWQHVKRFKWRYWWWSSWKFDKSGNLVLGRGWSRLIARVPPGQQEIVAEILTRKLGTNVTLPKDNAES